MPQNPDGDARSRVSHALLAWRHRSIHTATLHAEHKCLHEEPLKYICCPWSCAHAAPATQTASQACAEPAGMCTVRPAHLLSYQGPLPTRRRLHPACTRMMCTSANASPHALLAARAAATDSADHAPVMPGTHACILHARRGARHPPCPISPWACCPGVRSDGTWTQM